MLVVLNQESRRGAGPDDVTEQQVAINPETIDRLVPDAGRTVKAALSDGETMTFIGPIETLVDKINRCVLKGEVL
jgi:hypothetical protein